MNVDVINQCIKWLQTDAEVFLITITQTWGTSPRPVGSMFAYSPSLDQQSGSLSGGCIEDDLVQYLRHYYSEKKHQSKPIFTRIYGKNEQESERFFLPCGGQIGLLIESITIDDLDHFIQLSQSLLANQTAIRKLSYRENSKHYQVLNHSKQSDIIQFDESQCLFSHLLSPQYELLIIGLGDVSLALIDIAQRAEFNVSVCEPRESFLKRYPTSNDRLQFHHMLPDDLIRQSFTKQNVAIVCLAHDPKVDDLALIEALFNSNAFYIGAMGSKLTSENRINRLKALGLSASVLSRLHAPIGLFIESKTPFEIAISIMAHLISERHKDKLRNKTKSKKTQAQIKNPLL